MPETRVVDLTRESLTFQQCSLCRCWVLPEDWEAHAEWHALIQSALLLVKGMLNVSSS